MASFKCFVVACVLVASAAAQVPVEDATPADPTQGDEQTTDPKRYKKDVLLSTITYAQPAVPLLNTVSPISAIHQYYRTVYPYYKTVYPYSYYPYYYYPHTNYPSSVYYLRK